MALEHIKIPPDAARDHKARELAKTAHLWPIVTLRKPWGSFKAGDQFRQTPNGYRCNAVVCECYDYVHNGAICKHVRAYALLQERPAVKPVLVRFEEIYGVCDARGCNEDRARGEHYCDKHVLVDAF